MFIGHFAVALAAKRVAPRTSLGVLVAAAQLLDMVWPPLVLAGVEEVKIEPGNTAFTPLNFVSYPYSHSLAMAAVWATVAAGIYWMMARYRRGAVVVGFAVLSHWVLDFITHRPDLPLCPGSATYVGLGLWNSIPATVIVEGLMFVGGVWLYAAGTRAKDKYGSGGLWAYVAFLAVMYLANMAGPPPNARAVAWAGLSMVVLALWAWRIDRHRVVTLDTAFA
jgi:membrane-bound metal-dependent hydrolase YbcI (DUF457 family)